MTASWDSLFLPSASQEAVAATLRQALENFGYTLFDPFGILPGKSYARSVRLFVAPVENDWVRIIGTPDPRLVAPLSGAGACLYLALHGTNAKMEIYTRGDFRQLEAELRPYLRPGRTADDLLRAIHDELPEIAEYTGPIFTVLPDDVQALSANVDPKQAQKMFDRLTGNLLKKTGSDENTASAARELINPPDWNSPGARRLHALVGCLTLPANWRDPDFVSLRDAYQLHARRQRKPDARLYPGDEETMSRVANALDYIPVYGGRDDG
jgi:hypothetical protein